jgi:hypothetical protein
MVSPSVRWMHIVFNINIYNNIYNEIDDPILRKPFLIFRARTRTYGA